MGISPSTASNNVAQIAAQVQQQLSNLRLESTDSDSDTDMANGKIRKHRCGRVRTTNDFVVQEVAWPHHRVYKGQARTPATFESLFIQEFVLGFITQVQHNNVSPSRKDLMLNHLRELMLDATIYPWPIIRNDHGVVLGQMEQDELEWSDRAAIQELRAQCSKTLDTPVSKIGSSPKPCVSFQRGTCHQDTDHESPKGEKYMHICAWCLKSRGCSCTHPERDCIAKTYKTLQQQKHFNGGL